MSDAEASPRLKAVRAFLTRSGWAGGSVVGVRYLAAGEYNENFLVEAGIRRYVLRLNHGSQLGLGGGQIAYEFAALQAVEPSGVTPRPLYVEPDPDGLPGGVLLMDYLPGRPLDYAADLERAGTAFARIHALSRADGPGAVLLRQAHPVRAIAAESLGLIERYPDHPLRHVRTQLLSHHRDIVRLGEMLGDGLGGEPAVVVNTEVNSGNFLVDGDTARLVDWEKAVVSSRYQDLGHFVAPTTTMWKTETVLMRQDRLRFLSAYRQELERLGAAMVPSLRQLEEGTAALERAAALRGMSWCFMAYQEYTRGERPLAHAATLDRIRMYLDNCQCFFG